MVVRYAAVGVLPARQPGIAKRDIFARREVFVRVSEEAEHPLGLCPELDRVNDGSLPANTTAAAGGGCFQVGVVAILDVQMLETVIVQ